MHSWQGQRLIPGRAAHRLQWAAPLLLHNLTGSINTATVIGSRLMDYSPIQSVRVPNRTVLQFQNVRFSRGFRRTVRGYLVKISASLLAPRYHLIPDSLQSNLPETQKKLPTLLASSYTPPNARPDITGRPHIKQDSLIFRKNETSHRPVAHQPHGKAELHGKNRLSDNTDITAIQISRQCRLHGKTGPHGSAGFALM